MRTQHLREPRRYLAAEPGAVTRRLVGTAELPFEFAMNGFRLVDGFEDSLFEQRTGLSASALSVALASARSRDLVENAGGRWRATPRGLRFLNEILVELLPDERAPQGP
jgi:oxygen-independent coproporphyrinogen-3 oxidase